MPVIDVPFGEWLPSQPSFKNPGCEVADNVIPTPGAYGPFLGAIGQAETVSDDVRGAAQLYNTAGTSVIVGGTDDSLFIRSGTITETTGLTSIGADQAWDFCRFNDFVIATAANNAPQYLSDIDSDTSWSALTGSPPTARRCARVGEFVMFGWCDSVPNRLQWSAFNNPTGSWAASRLTQANSADLDPRFGGIQKIVGGRYAIVFQERGIQRITYVGPPIVWRADIISEDRGTLAPFSVVTVGYNSFFLANDGFFATNGAAVDPIGTSRVNNWFFENVNQDRITEVHGAVDWQNECVVWAFHGAQSETYNRLIIYSWAQNRWSTATINTGWLVASNFDGITLEDLDAIYGDLDSVPFSLDSARFRFRQRVLSAFINSPTTSEYSVFAGQPLRATFETGEFQPSPMRSVHVDEVAVSIEAENWDMLVTLLMRDNKGRLTTSAEKAIGNHGYAPVRGEAKKMGVRVVKPAGGVWEGAQGIQVRFSGAGET